MQTANKNSNPSLSMPVSLATRQLSLEVKELRIKVAKLKKKLSMI